MTIAHRGTQSTFTDHISNLFISHEATDHPPSREYVRTRTAELIGAHYDRLDILEIPPHRQRGDVGPAPEGQRAAKRR